MLLIYDDGARVQAIRPGGELHVRKIIPIALILLSVPMLAQTIGTAKPNKMSNGGADTARFVGAWRIVSVTDTRPDGTEVPDLYLGAHPAGVLVYEAAGHLCFGAMNADRDKWADGNHGTRTELATAAEGYDSYCGAYEIDEGRKTITHHVQIALVPNDVGTDLVRNYEFSGNQLKLRGTNALEPGFKLWTVTFERAAATK